MAMPATPHDIHAAAALLRAGHVVAFPTETVYGLGADALNPAAVSRVFQLKGRPSRNPLIVHVADEVMARTLAAVWPEEAVQLARRFWPGPLSIVLPKRPEVPDVVTGGAGSRTVAIRCPDHPVALALLHECATPLVGPSANLSGQVSPTTAAHVLASFPTGVVVLDGGACSKGIESTVISLAEGESPRILRLGVITPDMIQLALGRPVIAPGVAGVAGVAGGAGEEGGEGGARDDDPDAPLGPLPSPGLLSRHYAPKAPASLLTRAEIEASLLAEPDPVVVLSFSGIAVSPPHRAVLLPREPHAFAARLYAAMHEADDTHPSHILIERPTGAGAVWAAILDRLRRATNPRQDS